MNIATDSTIISTVSATISAIPSILPKATSLNINLELLLKILGIGTGVGIIGILGYIANVHQGLQSIVSLYESIKNWWVFKLPAQKVLSHITQNKTELKIFVRDFFIQQGTPLYSQEGLNGQIGIVPNVGELWPRVEGIGLSKILNTLGKLDKTDNIEIIEMGKDPGIWNKDLIILGAQTQKCFDFYQKMQEVAYKINATDIIKISTGRKVTRAQGYGYGIVLKCKNPFITTHKGFGFLVGGYGVLGTEAATHYFANHIQDFGRDFGNKSFGIVVRVSVTAGVQSTERLRQYDVKF